MKKLLFFLLLTSVSGWAQGSFYQLPQPLPNASVRVCTNPPTANPCTSLASIFSDQALTQGIANPFPVGSTGNFGFWVTGGQYVIQVGPPYNLNYVISLGGGGGGSFSTVTAGTNTNALVVGTGGTLATSGTGMITSTNINSGTSLPAQPCTAGAVYMLTGSAGNADIQFNCLGVGGNGYWIRLAPGTFPNLGNGHGPNNVRFASEFGVVADSEEGDCTTTATSNIVTCPNGNFLNTAHVGDFVQGGIYASGNALARTTVQSVDSATQIHTVGNAILSGAGTVVLKWGPDQTANLTRAWNATGAINGFLIMQPGDFFTTTAQFITPSAGGGGGIICAASGWLSCTIVPTSDFNWATCTGGASSIACFFGQPNETVDGMHINGLFAGTDPASNHFMAENNGGYFSRMQVASWCPGCAHTFGIVSSNIEPIFREGASIGAAAFACFMQGNAVIAIVSPCLGATGQFANPVHGLWISGGDMTSYANLYGQAGTTGVEVQAAGSLSEYGDRIIGTTINAGSHFIEGSLFGNTVTNNSGGILRLINNRMNSVAVTNNSGGTVIDMCGNITFGTVTNSGTWYNCKNANANVIVTAAKLVLSAGWGTTAAWTALTGWNDFTGTITASGTGQAANPTITYTFPNPYPAAPQNCQATILKSNDAGVTIANYALTPSSLTATGVVWTYTGTPVAADTYTVQGTCTN